MVDRKTRGARRRIITRKIKKKEKAKAEVNSKPNKTTTRETMKKKRLLKILEEAIVVEEADLNSPNKIAEFNKIKNQEVEVGLKTKITKVDRAEE